MTQLDKNTIVSVLGAGTMGSGIAQVAATYGHQVRLFDVNEAALEKAGNSLNKIMNRLVEKGRQTRESADAIIGRITHVSDLAQLEGSGLVIEAIIENLEIKRQTFQRLEEIVPHDCILASNTSSLSIANISAACKNSGRFLGAHFFNPAPLMPLVEIIPGVATDEDAVVRTRKLIDDWGKVTVLAKDTPGFIVNRVARPFYGEAVRILEEGIADAPTIDWAMRELGGFRMGPFQLMDFIGNDINFKVTQTVWESFFYDARYKPSFTQQRLVEAGRLGRKSGRGYYNYAEGASNPEPNKDTVLGQKILDRILAMLINEAVDAVFWQVASAKDVDLAMTKGVNYPKGLLTWSAEVGMDKVLADLEALRDTYQEDRYRPSPLMRQMVREGKSFENL